MNLIVQGVLPGVKEVLEELGVHSHVVEMIVATLALLTLIGGGLTFLYKLGRGLQVRLQVRKGDGKRRLRRRSAFAIFVESRIRDLDNKEEWSDQRFAELEAEVETIGVRRRGRKIVRSDRGLRRERSLSQALMKTEEQLVLLQGDPGSGKSVALRFVARRMAAEAAKSKRLDEIIPLYVNLKGLHRVADRPIDAKLIEDFILDSLREGATADVDRFLEDEFENGKLEGSWFFLFDSFDEIPELLSSTDVDSAVSAYSDAISYFIHGVNKCRGVIASRHFRAPPKYGLPTFTIVPLSEKRRRELVNRADLAGPESKLLDNLPVTDAELSALSENPLFLGLLVEYVRENHTLPRGWYDVFEAFVSRRVATHQEKLIHHFGIDPDDLRQRAEEIAFTMTATSGLGLSPRRNDLRTAYEDVGFTAASKLDVAMDALQWTKLARSEEGNASSVNPTFTFAHRRFQEYFATRVVLRDPDHVTSKTLLTDASWRETAVTLCQVQPASSQAIIDCASELLGVAATVAEAEANDNDFAWQPGTLHVLGLLQSAFAGNTNVLPLELRRHVSKLLLVAMEHGTITDRKWALEVAGTAPAADMASMLLSAFRGRSGWLREVAYRQAARLPSIPIEIATEIRRALIALVVDWSLFRNWRTTKAQVMRLRPSATFLASARVLRLAAIVDLLVCMIGLVVAIGLTRASPVEALGFTFLTVALHASYYAWAAMLSRGRGFSKSVVASLRARRGPYDLFGLISSLLMTAGLEFRAFGALLPILVGVLTGDSVFFVIAPFWIYALSWSITATAVIVDHPPRTAPEWLLVPFRVGLGFMSTLRKVRPSSVAWMLMGALTVGLFWFGVSKLPESTEIIIVIFFAGISGLMFLAIVIRSFVLEIRSRLWVWRWSKQSGSQVSGTYFLERLSVAPGSTAIRSFVADIRVRRLLKEDDEAEEIVRDLLRAAQAWSPARPNDLEPEVPVWRSPAFASWVSSNGEAVRHLSNAGVEDLLGQLLEDLGRDKEVPVA